MILLASGILVGIAAVGAALLPLYKLYKDAKDRDREAMLESARVAQQLKNAWGSIAELQGAVDHVLANQAKMHELKDQLEALVKQHEKPS